MQLTNEQQELLENFADDNDVSFTTSYSGRGMYGKKCIGFTCDNPIGFCMELALFLARDEEEDLAESMATRSTTDNMGRSTVVYFPGIQAAKESDFSEDDEDED